MSDTPRTDLELLQTVCEEGDHVESAFAAQLERELNRYKAAVEKFLALASDTCNCPGCRTAREVRASLERSA